MRYKLAIFDCDGTLVDTATDVALCMNEALLKNGYLTCKQNTVFGLIGKPLESIIEGLMSDGHDRGGPRFSNDDVVCVSEDYRAIYKLSKKSNTRPFEGVVQLLSELRASGASIGVNSNKPEDALIDLMNNLFPGNDFIIRGYLPGGPVKPDPSGAWAIMELAHVSASESVYIGDTTVDLDTAINLKTECIIVKWGQGSQDLYNQKGLLACCDNVQQLRNILIN